jgi:hypothetical protein
MGAMAWEVGKIFGAETVAAPYTPLLFLDCINRHVRTAAAAATAAARSTDGEWRKCLMLAQDRGSLTGLFLAD